jgi:hypothetical protein
LITCNFIASEAKQSLVFLLFTFEYETERSEL